MVEFRYKLERIKFFPVASYDSEIFRREMVIFKVHNCSASFRYILTVMLDIELVDVKTLKPPNEKDHAAAKKFINDDSTLPQITRGITNIKYPASYRYIPRFVLSYDHREIKKFPVLDDNMFYFKETLMNLLIRNELLETPFFEHVDYYTIQPGEKVEVWKVFPEYNKNVDFDDFDPIWPKPSYWKYYRGLDEKK